MEKGYSHFRKNLFLCLFLFVFWVNCLGCSYLQRRANDFGDCFKIKIGAGLGANADLRIGPLHYGIGYWNGYEIGLSSDLGIGCWNSEYYGSPFPISFISSPLLLKILETEEKKINIIEKNLAPYTTGFIQISKRRNNGVLMLSNRLSIVHLTWGKFRDKNEGMNAIEKWTDMFWVEASLRVMLGVKLGFNAAEFFDFLLGWFGVDIASDDH